MSTTKRSQMSSNVLARGATGWNATIWFLTSALAAFGVVWSLQKATPTEASGISTSGQVVETKMNDLGTEIYMLDSGSDTLEVIEASSGSTLSSISMPMGTGSVQDMDFDVSMNVAYVSTSTGDIIQVDPVALMSTALLTGGAGSWGQICVDTVTAGDVACTMDLSTMDLYGVSNIGGLTLLGTATYTSQGDLFEMVDASSGGF